MDAQCGVEEDCEKRGSLLLGTIPEFTHSAIQAMSEKWSWTEERTEEQLQRRRNALKATEAIARGEMGDEKYTTDFYRVYIAFQWDDVNVN